MNIQLLYKSLIIEFENKGNSIKVDVLKKTMKNSLHEYLMKNDSEKDDKTKKQGEISISTNEKIKNQLLDLKTVNGKPSIDEIKELLNSKYEWKIYVDDLKSGLPIEKKNGEYLKLDSSFVNLLPNLTGLKDNVVAKIVLNQIIKKNRFNYTEVEKGNEKNKKKKLIEEFNDSNCHSIEELIMKATGAKEKLTLEKKNNNNRLNFLGGEDGRELILQALMNFEGENPQASNLIETLLMNRLGQPGGNSNVRVSVQSGNQSNSNSSAIPNRFQSIRERLTQIRSAPITPDANKVAMLVEMGFEEARARRALIMTRNNLEAAVEVIANDSDLGVEVDEEPQSQSTSNINVSNTNQVQSQVNIVDDFPLDSSYNEMDYDENEENNTLNNNNN